MKRYKIAALLIAALMLVAAFAGCSGGSSDSGKDTLTGSTEDILADVVDRANAKLGEAYALPPLLTDPVTGANTEGMLGIGESDFTKYVDEATVSTGALNVNAFEVALVKCKDIGDAGAVKDLIAAGFNSEKWICVFPEESAVMISGSYVLLAVGKSDEVAALAEAFGTASKDNASDPDTFYEGPVGGAEGGDAIQLG